MTLSESQSRWMFELLRELVLIQSSTDNKPGVDRVGQALAAALDGLELRHRIYRQEDRGDHHLFMTAAAQEGDNKPVLLCGHMDTVFPIDTSFNWYLEEGDRIRGPGVIDMKGGLVVFVGAIRLLAAQGRLHRLPLMLFFNSDEEQGSPTSIPILKKLAKRARCALVAECGGLQGEVVTGRRGKRGYRLLVHGRAGHAAFASRGKASAILELAHKIVALEQLNDPDREIVVNVGKVTGGIGPNTVAEEATALIDTRFRSRKDGEWLGEKIQEICLQSWIAGTSATVEVTNERPVMEPSDANRQMLDLIRRCAAQWNMELGEEFRAGVSDANTLASAGIPVLDGLGPVGDCDHSDREYMLRKSLPERTALVAAALPSLAVFPNS